MKSLWQFFRPVLQATLILLIAAIIAWLLWPVLVDYWAHNGALQNRN